MKIDLTFLNIMIALGQQREEHRTLQFKTFKILLSVALIVRLALVLLEIWIHGNVIQLFQTSTFWKSTFISVICKTSIHISLSGLIQFQELFSK